MNVLFVALGSAIGGVGRYLAGLALPAAGGFPWATLCVNVLGSLVLGAVRVDLRSLALTRAVVYNVGMSNELKFSVAARRRIVICVGRAVGL